MKRRRIVLGISAAVALAGAPAASATPDARVLRDSVGVANADALAGTIVYSRYGSKHTKHPWIRVVDGRRHVAHLRAGLETAEALGRDRSGHVVLPYMTGRRTGTALVGRRWWLYDVRRDRSRPLRGLPTGACAPQHVAIWRTWLAYERHSCRYGVFLRRGSRTQRLTRSTVSDEEHPPLVLRGRTLAMIRDAGDGDFSLWQLVVDGRVCPAEIPGSAGAADDTFHVRAAWLNGRRLSWWVEGTTEGLPAPVAGNLVLGTTLHRDCSAPSPTAAYAPLPNRPVALDGASRYHTDGRTLVRRDVSAGPSLAPPDNADVAHAQLITRTPPIFIGAHIGYAIRAASDPPVRGRRAGYAPTAATRTLWFDFRPPEAQRLLISGGGGPFGGDLTYGALAVYDDAGDGVLTELPARPGSDPPAVEVRADPSHRYLIAVGCDDAGPCWPASWIQISPAASAGPVAAPRR